MGGNQLTRLPGCVPELRALEVLDLRGNTIESLPDDLKYMRSLLDLDLEGNPIGPEVTRKHYYLSRRVTQIARRGSPRRQAVKEPIFLTMKMLPTTMFLVLSGISSHVAQLPTLLAWAGS